MKRIISGLFVICLVTVGISFLLLKAQEDFANFDSSEIGDDAPMSEEDFQRLMEELEQGQEKFEQGRNQEPFEESFMPSEGKNEFAFEGIEGMDHSTTGSMVTDEIPKVPDEEFGEYEIPSSEQADETMASEQELQP